MSNSPSKSSHQNLQVKILKNSIDNQKQMIKEMLFKKYNQKYPKDNLLKEKINIILEQKFTNKITPNSLIEIENGVKQIISQHQDINYNGKSQDNIIINANLNNNNNIVNNLVHQQQQKQQNKMTHLNSLDNIVHDVNFTNNVNKFQDQKQELKLPKINFNNNNYYSVHLQQNDIKNSQREPKDENLAQNKNNYNSNKFIQNFSPEPKQNMYHLQNQYVDITPHKRLNPITGKSYTNANNLSTYRQNNISGPKIIKKNDIYIFDSKERDQWGEITKFKEQQTTEEHLKEKLFKRESQNQLKEYLLTQIQNKQQQSSHSQSQQHLIQITRPFPAPHSSIKEYQNNFSQIIPKKSNEESVFYNKKHLNDSVSNENINMLYKNQLLDEQRLKERRDKIKHHFSKIEEQIQDNLTHKDTNSNKKKIVSSHISNANEENFIDKIKNNNEKLRKEIQQHENQNQSFLQQQIQIKQKKDLLKSELNSHEYLNNQHILKQMYEQQQNSVDQRIKTDF